MSFLIEDYSLDNNNLLKNESIFHVVNGYLGIRGNFEEGYARNYKTIRGAYINAFHEVNKLHYSEKLHGFPEEKQNILNVIDAQTIILVIDGERFTLFDGDILNYKRYFNLKEGHTIREIHWKSNKGHELKINIKRLASFNLRELFLINYEVESINYDGKIILISALDGDVSNFSCTDDPRVSSENIKSLKVKNTSAKNGILNISATTVNSGLEISCSVFNKLSKPAKRLISADRAKIKTAIISDIKAGETVKLAKYVVYTDSMRYKRHMEKSIELCREAAEKPQNHYFMKQKEYLNKFWRSSDLEIEGNEAICQGMHYNIYQLLQSVGNDKFSNICAKGLSGEGYEGHYFWDTEIYMFPFFLLTEPNIAKNLLLYRCGTLDAARRHAKELGHKKGALYPWRTITGGECSGYFPSGTAQYHINADIAYSFIKYYQVTEDNDFIRLHGAEVMFETARLWLDTGHFKDGLFKIDAVTGPDEYTCIVNNNYYTNVMAKYNFKWAVNFYKLLKDEFRTDFDRIIKKISLSEEEFLDWERAYKNMYLPYDSKLDINPQDDSFLSKAIWDFENTPKENYPLLLNYHPLILYRYQVCKQADTVLAHFLLEEEQNFSTIKNSYDYYEKVTTHDSSLSHCIFSIMAARIGYMQKAYDYFIESARLDLDDTHGNTKDGIHTANMGGTYLSVVYGFAGLRINQEGISFRPCVPQEWNGYSFKINYRKRIIKVKVTKTDIELTLEKGEPVDIFLEPHKTRISLGYEPNTKTIKHKLNLI